MSIAWDKVSSLVLKQADGSFDVPEKTDTTKIRFHALDGRQLLPVS